MGTNTKIEWCDHTFNPWRGCSHVSAGCDHCYAERQSKRNPRVLGHWGEEAPRAMAAEAHWKLPLRWHRDAEKAEVSRRVFCASLGDVFEDRAELIAPRRRLFSIIDQTPWLDWLLLTKRPHNIRRLWIPIDEDTADARVLMARAIRAAEATARSQCTGSLAAEHGAFRRRMADDQYRGNVWLLTSVENENTVDRTSHLLQCGDLSPILGLSCEPLLGPVRLGLATPCDRNCSEYQNAECPGTSGLCIMQRHVDWVIVGGESGPNARPMHPDWARSIRDQCQAAGVPFFFKGWGEWSPFYDRDMDDPDWRSVPLESERVTRINLHGGHGFHGERVVYFRRVGKKTAGRLLDGREWSELPNTNGTCHGDSQHVEAGP